MLRICGPSGHRGRVVRSNGWVESSVHAIQLSKGGARGRRESDGALAADLLGRTARVVSNRADEMRPSAKE